MARRKALNEDLAKEIFRQAVNRGHREAGSTVKSLYQPNTRGKKEVQGDLTLFDCTVIRQTRIYGTRTASQLDEGRNEGANRAIFGI